MRIGLTGQIGSGKTTAAKILSSFGAAVISADEIGREIVDRSLPLRSRLARRFGTDILTKGGRLRRSLLASKAFFDSASTKALNDLVHPYLLKELRRQLKELERTHEVVVVDAALLLYWNLDREMDLTLVIHAGEGTRMERTEKRGISVSDAKARQAAQLPYADFRGRASRLILNNGSVADLRRKLSDWYRKFAAKRSGSG